jgi:ornithine carbamoyltransferase
VSRPQLSRGAAITPATLGDNFKMPQTPEVTVPKYKNFLHVDDYSYEEIKKLIELAKMVKAKIKAKDSEFKPFKDHTLGMIFAKDSSRTRVSFETGFTRLGGHAIFLSNDTIGLGKREETRDIARVFSGYVDIIMARLYKHDDMLELAKNATIPVINGLTDYNHPC